MRLAASRFRLGELHTRLKEQARIDLRLIIKADVQGSVEVLRDSMRSSRTSRSKSSSSTPVWAHQRVGCVARHGVRAVIVVSMCGPIPRRRSWRRRKGSRFASTT